jgi:hypothetical protein
MIRIYKHIKKLRNYLSTLQIECINLSIQASRTGWNADLQKSITNNALLIRKYERRLKLIKMVS